MTLTEISVAVVIGGAVVITGATFWFGRLDDQQLENELRKNLSSHYNYINKHYIPDTQNLASKDSDFKEYMNVGPDNLDKVVAVAIQTKNEHDDVIKITQYVVLEDGIKSLGDTAEDKKAISRLLKKWGGVDALRVVVILGA